MDLLDMLGHPAALGGGGFTAGFMRQSCQCVRAGISSREDLLHGGRVIIRVDIVRMQRRQTAARVTELSRESTFRPRRPAEHITGSSCGN